MPIRVTADPVVKVARDLRAIVTEPGHARPSGSQVGSYATVVSPGRNGTIQEGEA